MMNLQGDLQGFDRKGHFGVLMVILRLTINRLYLLTFFSKILEVCFSAAMALISRFELIVDEYLHEALECREVMSRFGWLEFLRKIFGFNMVVSKTFAESFDGVNAHVGDVELRLTKEFISQAIGLPQTSKRWYKGKHIKNDHWKGFLTPSHR